MLVPAVVKVWVVVARWKQVVIGMGFAQLCVRNKAVEKQRKLAQQSVQTRASGGNAFMHGIVARDKKAGVQERKPRN